MNTKNWVPSLAGLKKLVFNPIILEGLITSFIFACIITLGHIYLFDLRVNPRMVLQPWLLQHGFLQYTNIPDEHSPLLPQILAWLLPIWKGNALHTMKAVYAFLIFMSVSMSLFWLNQKYGRWAAFAGGAYFIAWSNFGGYWAMWYDLALGPFYLFIFFNLIRQIPLTFPKLERKMFILGLAGGISFLIKQQALLAIVVTIIWSIYQFIKNHIPLRQLIIHTILYGVGVLLPLFIYLGFYWFKGGSISDLYYWTIIFNFTNNYSKLGLLLPNITQVQEALPAFLLLLPLCFSTFYPLRKKLTSDKNIRFWLLIFLAISAIMQYPRYSSMHWATALPFLGIGTGVVCSDLFHFGDGKPKGQIICRSIYMVIVLSWLSSLFTAYLPLLSRKQPRQLIEYQPLQELAAQLKHLGLSRADLIIFPDNEAVSNLYYLLNTSPPNYWLMTYPWFMNRFTIGRWEETLDKEKPQTAILFESQFDWTSNQEALNYIHTHYQTVSTLEWQGYPVDIMTRRNVFSP